MITVDVAVKKATKKEINKKPYMTGLTCRTCENHVGEGENYFYFRKASFVENENRKHDDIFCSYSCLTDFLEKLT